MTTENGVIDVYALQNNIYYFLQAAWIIEFQTGFKLLVIHCNRVLTEKSYLTLGGAKESFAKLYKYRIWAPDVRPRWEKNRR